MVVVYILYSLTLNIQIQEVFIRQNNEIKNRHWLIPALQKWALVAFLWYLDFTLVVLVYTNKAIWNHLIHIWMTGMNFFTNECKILGWYRYPVPVPKNVICRYANISKRGRYISPSQTFSLFCYYELKYNH